jgi:hypothetical protein
VGGKVAVVCRRCRDRGACSLKRLVRRLCWLANLGSFVELRHLGLGVERLCIASAHANARLQAPLGLVTIENVGVAHYKRKSAAGRANPCLDFDGLPGFGALPRLADEKSEPAMVVKRRYRGRV